MYRLLVILFVISAGMAYGQPPEMEVTRNGFSPITMRVPAMAADKFVEVTKAWAGSFTNREGGYDAKNITGNTITISALKRNAMRYQNVGQTVENKIRYNLEITFTATSYTVRFVVVDIYGDNDTLLDYRLPDYYKSDGTLKDGYRGLDTSLETTANNIVQSYHDFIINYR